jgi:dihydroorotase
VDPAAGIDGPRDLLLDGEVVAAVEPAIPAGDHEVIDCRGKVVCPGFVDLHVHLREPGLEEDETIASGTAAAVAGGFTAVACMPNTRPVNDDQSVTDFIVAQARRFGACRVYPIGAVTRGLRGEELTEFGDLVESGAAGFSDDGRPVASGLVMRRALEYSLLFDVPIIDHPEDPALADDGVMNEGFVSTSLGLRGHSRVAEEAMVMRDLLLAELTGARLHLAHVSTAGSVAMIRAARARGVRCTAEATPHHLLLTDEAVRGYDTRFKMKPPLRTEADRQALIEAVADGTIDAIATDHAPHHPDKKKVEFSLAPFGVIGLETAVPVVLDRLVRPGRIGLPRLAELLSVAPNRILRRPGGTLRPGSPADVTVLDLEAGVTVDAGRFRSLSRNTPFGGWKLRGAPHLTLVAGEVKHAAGGAPAPAGA